MGNSVEVRSSTFVLPTSDERLPLIPTLGLSPSAQTTLRTPGGDSVDLFTATLLKTGLSLVMTRSILVPPLWTVPAAQRFLLEHDTSSLRVLDPTGSRCLVQHHEPLAPCLELVRDLGWLLLLGGNDITPVSHEAAVDWLPMDSMIVAQESALLVHGVAATRHTWQSVLLT